MARNGEIATNSCRRWGQSRSSVTSHARDSNAGNHDISGDLKCPVWSFEMGTEYGACYCYRCCYYCRSAVAVAATGAAFVAVSLLLLLLLLLLPLLLLLMLLPNMLFNAISFDSTYEHNFHFHYVRLKPPSMTLSSATFYSTPARSTLHNIYMLYYYSTNKLSHSPIAPNNEKRSYCSCCIIGDFFFSWRRFGDRWLSRECPLSRWLHFVTKNKARFSVFRAFDWSKIACGAGRNLSISSGFLPKNRDFEWSLEILRVMPVFQFSMFRWCSRDIA